MSTDWETVRSYDAAAAEYAAEAANMPNWVETEIGAFVEALGGSGRVLEIGSGGGRDALAFEKRGIDIRRTDISDGFVELLRGQSFEADQLDPLTDNLDDRKRPGVPYDGVWACASLIHVAREDLVTVLSRLAAASRRGGPLHVSVRDGDGEDISEDGSGNARRIYRETYWREDPLGAAVSRGGWSVAAMLHYEGRPGDRWLSVRAVRK